MKFFDTNILVYVADIRDSQKQRIAEDLVTTALGTDGFLISEQVLNEFSSIALSKLKISKDAIKEYLKFFRGIATVTFPDHVAERGLDIAERYHWAASPTSSSSTLKIPAIVVEKIHRRKNAVGKRHHDFT